MMDDDNVRAIVTTEFKPVGYDYGNGNGNGYGYGYDYGYGTINKNIRRKRS